MVAARVLGPERLTTARSELLGQRDDDARGAADVAELVVVLELLHLAHKFGAMGMQAKARTSSMSSTANMMRRMPSVFAGALAQR